MEVPLEVAGCQAHSKANALRVPGPPVAGCVQALAPCRLFVMPQAQPPLPKSNAPGERELINCVAPFVPAPTLRPPPRPAARCL